MLVFYRGKHCPICKKYLTELGGKLGKFTDKGINVFAVSMDSPERAAVSHEEWETGDVPIAHSLSEEKAREWGLYISKSAKAAKNPTSSPSPACSWSSPMARCISPWCRTRPSRGPTSMIC